MKEGQTKRSQFQVDVLDPFLDLVEGPQINIRSPHNKNVYACLETRLRNEQRRAGLFSPKNTTALTGFTSNQSDQKDEHRDILNKTFESFWADNPSVDPSRQPESLRRQRTNASDSFSSDD